MLSRCVRPVVSAVFLWLCFAGGLAAAGLAAVEAQEPARLTIDTTQSVTPVSPMLYGLMTEEINHSYEGGLYAEMVSNNTFHGNWMGTEAWGVVRKGKGRVTVATDKTAGPSAALPTSLKVTVMEASAGNEVGVTNVGYWGMGLRPRTTYHGSMYAAAGAGDAGAVTVQLVNDTTGAVVAKTQVALSGAAWTQYKFVLTTGAMAASTANHMEMLLAKGPASVSFQLVSLMGPTFNDRPNGNRPDLMKMMAAMHAKFLRLPGGNYLEGDRLEDWYNWKKTIGPDMERPGHMAPWTYWSDDQFGLLEFLEWTEDLKIEPVLAVYAGYSLKHDYIKPGKDLEPFVQAALDEVEYCTGDVTTKWGAERAKDGHPAAFPLHYIEIGNEDEFDKSGSYDERFAQFAVALRAKYPQYKLIATTPVKEKAGAEADVLDDHYYKSPEDMFALVHQYDAASRTGPKIFVGEWATRSGSPTPNMADALGDAAWMTSMERNSDLVVMSSYAPMLVNVNPGGMEWVTDLIGYDALTSYGSPSYYAQAMFASHLGDGTPKSEISGVGDRFFYSATVGAADKVLHLKLVNATSVAQPMEIALKGMGAGAHTGKMTSLHGATFQATNSITAPERIKPVEGAVSFTGAMMRHTVPAYSIEVVDVVVQ